MFARALIVLLLVLNVGVATWWMTRVPPTEPVSTELPPGVVRLQLVDETLVAALPAATPMTAPAAEPSPVGAAIPATRAATFAPVTPQCFTFGPFTDDQVAVAAQARLQPLTRRIVVREQRRGSSRGWRVMVPPLPSADQAAATAQRIAAAGFNDYFVVRDGNEANSIALGRYGNETAARRRVESLAEAGFAARAEPLGGVVTWLDTSAAPGFDALAAKTLVSAPEHRPLDCAALDGPPAAAR